MLTPVLTSQFLPLYRADQVRELDRRAIQDHAIAGYTLMCLAGQAAFILLQEHWPQAQRIAVVCGGGNNAGDGYVVARLAHEAGYKVDILTLQDPQKLSNDAATAWQQAHAIGLQAQPFNDASDLHTHCDVIIDAMLGTGLQRPLAGRWADAVEWINQSQKPVLALDIPSGLAADTGAVLGCAINAAVTVTFIGVKQGLLTASGPDYCGKLYFDDLDTPPAIFDDLDASSQHEGTDFIRRQLQPRSRSSHKGRHGHVLVIGGDHGMAGAVRLAAEAAARCGAGLISIATRAEHAGLQAAQRPELMFHGVENASALAPLVQRATVLAIGPGLGQADWGRELLQAALASNKPCVIDADALNLLAVQEQPLKRDDWILTPHPGEAARLLGTDTSAIQADRFQAIKTLQARYGGVIVLKGAGSLISANAHKPSLCSAGNPGMGSGGMGDVLCGVIASILAQSQYAPSALYDAARIGTWLHAQAGDLAAQDGERGMLAGDLLVHLRRLVNPV